MTGLDVDSSKRLSKSFRISSKNLQCSHDFGLHNLAGLLCYQKLLEGETGTAEEAVSFNHIL